MFQCNYSTHCGGSFYQHTPIDEPPVDYSEDEHDEPYSRHHVHTDLNAVAQLPVIHFKHLWFECLVGQGGFGKVYRAKYNGRLVAIKEPIYYDTSLVRHINEAIISEARLHYHLSHPNIVQLHGISFQAERVFLVMEYAKGKSLRELISKRTLSPNVIIKFAIQISSAMEYLHNFQPRAIIHRDLKSPNSE